MPVIASADDAAASRRRASSNGTGFWLTSYIGANRYSSNGAPSPGPGAIYPMAFLVEQDPGAVVGAHYHQADQFQIVVAGSGRLGIHDVAAGAVHYAGAWSAYGPLSAGAAGLSYFTLRNGWDPGARYMEVPANRADLRARPRGHREVVGHLPQAPDGLWAETFRLAAGEALAGPAPARGFGQFWIVLRGSLRHDAATLGPRSCVFIAPEDAPMHGCAGSEGLEAVAVQFPAMPFLSRAAGEGGVRNDKHPLPALPRYGGEG
jgi:hypothetical protein